MADPRSTSDTGTPRWVKVFGIIFLAVVLLFLILLFTRGPHRPGDHMSSGGANGHGPARTSR
jgi:hypothetical protein